MYVAEENASRHIEVAMNSFKASPDAALAVSSTVRNMNLVRKSTLLFCINLLLGEFISTIYDRSIGRRAVDTDIVSTHRYSGIYNIGSSLNQNPLGGANVTASAAGCLSAERVLCECNILVAIYEPANKALYIEL